MKIAAALSLLLMISFARASTESSDRNVDRAAIASQKTAINKLKTLKLKYAGRTQEPTLLFRLAEATLELAMIEFRVRQGSGKGDEKPTLRSAIAQLSELLRRFPNDSQVGLSTFLRAQAREQINDENGAKTDYETVALRFSTLPEAMPARLALADIATHRNQHAEAIDNLLVLVKVPEHPLHPFALHKIAWAYTNVGDVERAREAIEKHATYYFVRWEKKILSKSDLAILETSLLDATLFYFEDFERAGDSKPSASDSLEYLTTLARAEEEGSPGSEILGRMILRFTRLLRAHDHEQSLLEWKENLITEHPDRPETLDAAWLYFEDRMNKHRFEDMERSASDFSSMFKGPLGRERPDAFDSVQKGLLAIAQTLQARTLKNKGANEVSRLSRALAAVYEACITVLPRNDPMIAKIHFNLAETFHEIRDFENATIHYRILVTQYQKALPKALDDPLLSSAPIRAISSRYEGLAARGFFPKEVKAKALTTEDIELNNIDPLLSEWISWLDACEKCDHFAFEASRALYVNGRPADALARLWKLATDHPESSFAEAAARLVIDTAIEGQDWVLAYERVGTLMEDTRWQAKPFATTLSQTALEACAKRSEKYAQEDQWEKSASWATRCLKRYAASPRRVDLWLLLSEAKLHEQQTPEAIAALGSALNESKTESDRARIHLKRALLHEESGDLRASAADLLKVLEFDPKQKMAAELRDKILLFSFLTGLTGLSGRTDNLNRALSSQVVCPQGQDSACEPYRALAVLLGGLKSSKSLAKSLAQKAWHGAKNARPLWAAAALEMDQDLRFGDQMLLVRIIASNWDRLDGIVKIAILPKISTSIPLAFQKARLEMNRFAPLRPDETSIARRLDLIKEYDNTASQVLKLPWVSLRAQILIELAQVYLDLSQELKIFEDAKDMAIAFAEKGETLRKEVSTKIPAPAWGLDLLNQVVPDVKWNDEEARSIPSRIASALSSKNPVLASYWILRAEEKKALETRGLTAARALVLKLSGAHSEALDELEEIADDLEGKAKESIGLLIAQQVD